MKTFTFQTVKQIYSGYQCIQHLNDWLITQQSTRVLIVTDAGLIANGLHQAVIDVLQHNQISYNLYSDIQADPPEHVVHSAVEFSRTHGIDTVIGFGGGSSLDVAKIIALMSHPEHQQSLNDMYGVEQVKGQRLPLVLIPTTAGTGSEVTPISIITTGETTKAGIVSSILYADAVFLDAQFSLNLPLSITAATGIDAMVHAIEAYTSVLKKNPHSDLLAVQALKYLIHNLPHILHDDLNPEERIQVRQNMLYGAMLAGQAFANAPVGAVHALAYPLGGRFHLTHGHSNAVVLCEVMRFNRVEPQAEKWYAELERHLNPTAASWSDQVACDAWIERLSQIVKDSQLPLALNQMQIQKQDIQTLAQDAMQQTRLLQNNPRPLHLNDAYQIYEAIY